MSNTTPPDRITGYHAHVYYNDVSRPSAAEVRAELEAQFEVVMGRWQDEPVGPHPEPMYQVTFTTDQFSNIVPWLMQHRRSLTVLVHPDTGNDVSDHRDYPLWLGAVLDLDLEFLERQAQEAGD